MTKVLITGAGGFVGHHFLEHVLHRTNWDIVATDSFRHKGTCDRIAEILDYQPIWHKPSWRSRTDVITHDLAAPFTRRETARMGDIDYIVAFASESHVDRSITDPVPFVRNNVDVVLSTLELARQLKPKALVLVSTDEVYGPVDRADYTGHPEWDVILPSNPYSASKAAQEAIAISYWRTYGVPLQIVNCMNMIGERQDPEKFVPLVLGKVMHGETVTVHGTPEEIGTRHYLHARNLADGITFLLTRTTPASFTACAYAPDRYNIAVPDRIDNLTMAQMIADYAGKPLHYELEDFHSTRPGHDPHYGLDGRKMAELGWTPPISLETSLKKTVEWTLEHPAWLLPG